jgi:hypothetical protein
MGKKVAAGGNFCSFAKRTSESAFSQFKGRLQLSGFGLPYTWDCAQLFDSALCKSSDSTKPI